jgi:manganese oxidase
MRVLFATVLFVLLPLGAAAQHGYPSHGAAPELAGYEDYRVAAGGEVGGVLRVELEARPVLWRPWGDDGPTLPAHTFAVSGEPARVPGPLLRVRAGQEVHVTLRNMLADTLIVRGLRGRGQPQPAAAFLGDSLVVAPGAVAEVRFTATVPGSFFYFGKTGKPGWSAQPLPLFGTAGPDRGLAGVLIVEDPAAPSHPDERILFLTQWLDAEQPDSWLPAARFMINGRAWPHTERLVYAQHDTVRWRVINFGGAVHPMHLHGFYFQVHEWTTPTGRPVMDMPAFPLAVTWPLATNTALRMSWLAHEPGNWLYHCHLMRHMSWVQHPPELTGPAYDAAAAALAPGHADHGGSDGDGGHASRAADIDRMGGLVIGITITPAADHAPAAFEARRRLRLYINRRDAVFADEPAYSFVLQEGAQPPAPDSVRFPGSPIVLTRGEPTEIVVSNQADVALGVHWHGLELESWADGVPGWSGMPGSTVPSIAPGDSLVVRMTPPRAGTFMYHVHSEPGHQLQQGLYGPFLVMVPDAPWDPDTDRIFLLGSLGAGEDAPPAVNGVLQPDTLVFDAGTTYRLRFMHISPDDEKSVMLFAGEEPVTWQPIARDGADLPPVLSRDLPATLRAFDVGTTFDFRWSPAAPGELTLRVITRFDPGLPNFPRPAPPDHVLDIPVRVR